MTAKILFEPYSLGSLTLSNRVVPRSRPKLETLNLAPQHLRRFALSRAMMR
jgi:2,4-dienoyl-CoA reductase-like NADH-dependent reductase (Old Yellow Enzyme family)